MALKATIFKVELAVADLDRNVYENFSLTLAQHPSENDARMMVRLLAFMLFADERLEFGRGISSDDEPDLWLKDLTGAIDLWISVGQLDERWLRKAAGRARRVVVLSYGDRAVDAWWEQNRNTLEKLSNLTVLRISADELQAGDEAMRGAMEAGGMPPPPPPGGMDGSGSGTSDASSNWSDFQANLMNSILQSLFATTETSA